MRVTRDEQVGSWVPGVPGFLALAMAALLGLGFAAVSTAHAGPTPDYGIDFVTIGDPGNRPVNQTEGPRFFPPYATEPLSVGRVNYRYRMARTEMSVGKWLEFVNSYAPYYDGPTNSSRFTSDWIVYDNQSGEYRAIAGSENYAANMSWRYAARYANWLHNGKTLDQAAFENGAYDTSTFGRDKDGNYTDQREHNPGARFWIPTLDEWTKAMHWDPGMNNGDGGYWRYPHSSNIEPVSGPPGFGDTNAGTGLIYDVGSYDDAISPWGLLDGSGGQSEYLESGLGDDDWKSLRGSSWALSAFADSIDRLSSSPPQLASGGLRLSSLIPAPASVFVLILSSTILAKRKRI